jgi:hypothetical protein
LIERGIKLKPMLRVTKFFFYLILTETLTNPAVVSRRLALFEADAVFGDVFFRPPRRFRRNRARHGKTSKFPITTVAQQIVAKQNFRPERRRRITLADATAAAFGTSLTNHNSL